MAGVTGLEPATSGVTGRRSNRLSYTPYEAALRAAVAGLWCKRPMLVRQAALSIFLKEDEPITLPISALPQDWGKPPGLCRL